MSHNEDLRMLRCTAKNRKNKIYLIPFVLLAIAELLFFLIKLKTISLLQPVVPLYLGWMKDIADIFIVIIFPWHGWVVLIPLIMEFFIGWNIRKVILIWFLSSLATAVIATAYNFKAFGVNELFTGIITYCVINLFVLAFVFIVCSIIKWGFKCIK